jgi:hypothetical protein
MSARRIARRIASLTLRQNTRIDGVSAASLATKVFHYPLQSFPSRRGRWQLGYARSAGTGLVSGAALPEGSGPPARGGAKRRVVCGRHPHASPFAAASLVTNGENGGAA